MKRRETYVAPRRVGWIALAWTVLTLLALIVAAGFVFIFSVAS